MDQICVRKIYDSHYLLTLNKKSGDTFISYSINIYSKTNLSISGEFLKGLDTKFNVITQELIESL